MGKCLVPFIILSLIIAGHPVAIHLFINVYTDSASVPDPTWVGLG